MQGGIQQANGYRQIIHHVKGKAFWFAKSYRGLLLAIIYAPVPVFIFMILYEPSIFPLSILIVNEPFSLPIAVQYSPSKSLISNSSSKGGFANEPLKKISEILAIRAVETNTIKELIIAKAFSNGEFDEEPKGDLMDPLGIKFI